MQYHKQSPALYEKLVKPGQSWLKLIHGHHTLLYLLTLACSAYEYGRAPAPSWPTTGLQFVSISDGDIVDVILQVWTGQSEV